MSGCDYKDKDGVCLASLGVYEGRKCPYDDPEADCSDSDHDPDSEEDFWDWW